MSFKKTAKDTLTSFKGIVVPAGKEAFNKIKDKIKNFDSDKFAETILYFCSYQFIVDSVNRGVQNIIKARDKVNNRRPLKDRSANR